ncbi:low molecular weight phosphatase family protein [Micromonospora zingiberis]|uniref:Low molecular weight phosphatase family protein n=1 Tax=Micromonospora zingiberis TaxID=2053011 RepID=A0A4R0GBB5_9ACTN|nr:low molecular weight phosphatase family protein [Micromonospora zingiberis]TCB94350.1 low molecular weight phosphatase family protein [Micromonospora zingiberis]
MVNGVLFVCHANLCRSPMAEYTARRMLAGRPVTVASAGTDAVADRPMHPYAAEIVAETGAEPADFRTRQLAPEHLTDAVLVLTATRRQRSICTALAPAALHRTFTLRQFGRLAAAVEPPLTEQDDPLTAAVAAATLARGRLQPAPGDADDLPDPVAGTAEDFRRCAEEIERSLRPLAVLIETAG